ncbi:MAG: hypothetical protein OEM91_14110 [Hyphomicrobiales bacterium]|nr:hypothetical protein [Hyphomicrobiales bacterium]
MNENYVPAGSFISDAQWPGSARYGALHNAILYVVATAPAVADNSEFGWPNVVLTPHSAGRLRDGKEGMAMTSAKGIEDVIEGHLGRGFADNAGSMGLRMESAGSRACLRGAK